MIACLTDLIGIRNVSGFTTSTSGLYINDLEGITTDQLDKIKDDTEEYDDVGSVWEKIYIRAKLLFEADIRRSMRKYLKKTSVKTNVITGQVYNNESISPSAFYKGQYFDFPITGHNLELHLNYGQVYVPVSSTVIINIYNFNTGDLLNTASQLGSGLVKVNLGFEYVVHEYPKIFVAVDHENITSYKATDYEIGGLWYNSPAIVSKAGSVIYSNLASGNIGLILNYHIRCSVSNFVCHHIDQFTTPFLYRLGIEFIKERLGSAEVNQYTLTDQPQAIALLEMFKGEYDLDTIIQGIQIEEDGLCFECNHPVTRKIMMP